MKMVLLYFSTFLLLTGLTTSVRSQSLPTDDPPPISSQSPTDPIDTALLSQPVESRRGYFAQIPSAARLDSSMSGWNPAKKFERRVYTIDGSGQIIITATVGEIRIPDAATQEGAYRILDYDTLTSAGTSYSRTYYLPTRSVQITLLPFGIGMRPYIDQRLIIFRSFRWKPGAESDKEDFGPEGTPVPSTIPLFNGLQSPG